MPGAGQPLADGRSDLAARARPLRRDRVLGLAVVIALFVVVFWPVLFGGRTFSTASTVNGSEGAAKFPDAPSDDHDTRFRLDPGASAWAMVPWSEFNAAVYDEGSLPLWNPYSAAGTPHLANAQSAPLDPLLAPVHATGGIRAWDLSLLLAYVLAAVAMYALLTSAGLTIAAAITGSTAFSLSGFVFVFGNNHWARPYLYLPLVVLGIDLIARDRLVAGAGVTATAVVGLNLAGMPEVTAVVLLAGGVVALARLGPCGVRALGWWSAAIVVGFLAAAPVLVPFLEYEGLAHTRHATGSGSASQQHGAERLADLALPFVRGFPRGDLLRGGPTGTLNWLGVSACLLAVIGFAGHRRSWERLQVATLAMVVVMAGLCYRLWYLDWAAHLPVIERIGFFRFGTPAVVFGVAVLAAYGIERIADRAVDVRRLAASCGAVIGLVGASVFSARRHLVEASGYHLVRWLGLAVVAASATIVLAVLAGRGKARAGRLAALTAATLVIEVFLLAPRSIYPNRVDPFGEPSWLAVIDETAERGVTDRFYGDDGLLAPDTSAALELHDVQIVDALVVDRFARFVRTFVEPEFDQTHFGRGETTRPLIDQNRAADLLGIRYHLSAHSLLRRHTLERLIGAEQLAARRLITVDLDGRRNEGLFIHASDEIEITWPRDLDRFEFEVGFEPNAPVTPEADGFRASIVAVTDAGEEELWTTTVSPGSTRWHRGSIATADVPTGAEIVLRIDERSNRSADWTVFAPVTETPRDGLRLLGLDGDVHVYERTSALPRAFVVPTIEIVDDDDDALEAMVRNQPVLDDGTVLIDGWDPARLAFVEAEPSDPALTPLLDDSGCTGRAEVHIIGYEPHAVDLSVDSPCPGLLVLTDTYYPGWHAEVNGRPQAIYPADLAFRSVFVDAGQSTVSFRYRPQSFRIGLTLAAATAAAVLAFWVAIWYRVRTGEGRRADDAAELDET